jgi:hypothetical protein
MSIATELKAGASRKRPDGYDPILNTRAPAPLIALVRAKAAERQVSVSALIREALARHVGSETATATSKQ